MTLNPTQIHTLPPAALVAAVRERHGRTQWQGEHDRYKVAVCETDADVIAFFGHGWLAKDLYEEAGIIDATDVE